MSRRQCCVVNCHNSGRKLQTWLEEICAIHGVIHRSCTCEETYRLFPFPTEKKDPQGRREWIRLVGRKSEKKTNKIWIPNEDSRVCSKHFVDESPTDSHPYPTLAMGHELSNTPKARKKPSRRVDIVTPKRSSPMPQQITSAHSESSIQVPQSHSVSEDVATVFHDHNYEWQGKTGCDGCNTKDDTIRRLKKMNQKLSVVAATLRASKKHFSHEFLRTDAKVNFYTGLPNRAVFDKLYETFEPKMLKLRFWRGPSGLPRGIRKFNKSPKKFGPNRKVSGKNQLLLTLMKIRLGLLNEDLGDRFGVSMSTCSRILTTTLKFLASELKCLVFNPPKEVQRANLPRRFNNHSYKNVRHIIDCTEVFIETPKNLEVKAQTWSNYKHHQTVKYLVSITPNGHFNFVSKAWGGRVSDKVLTQNCGFLDVLERNDVVLADRGFPIAEDVALHHAYLHIPPGRRGAQQMTQAEVAKTKEIANLLIFIEQAIRRLKTFRFLKYEVPITMLPHIDNIVTVCAALCNMLPPLVKY